jgi:hypothetical protein
LTTSTATTIILALKEKELMKTKTMINNAIIEQVKNFNYLDCHLDINRNYDLKNKLKLFDYPVEKLSAHCSTKLKARHPKILQSSNGTISVVWQRMLDFNQTTAPKDRFL